MSGITLFNFPAFDEASAALKAKGFAVISPADLDREAGFDPLKGDSRKGFDMEACIRRDVEAVLTCDAVVLLPGWDRSKGCAAEIALAKWADKEVLLYPSMQPIASECVLAEAARIQGGDRQAQYGPPDQDFRRIAAMWGALKGVPFTAREVAMFMVCVKLSRETHQKKRDNWVDIAGYAKCGSLCGGDV